jgi:hypothetical protein
MLRPERQPDPGWYGRHCGNGQLTTHQVQPEDDKLPPTAKAA